MTVTHELELELKRDVYKESYFEFFKWSFKILKPNDSYEDAPHIKYLCDILQEEVFRMKRREEKGKDIIINIPPRTSKSLITSVCLMPWVWLHIPTAPFICVSYEDKLSLKNAQDSKDLIKSDQFVELFNDFYSIRRDADSKEFFANNKGGERLSTTTQSSVTGFSALIEIIDDPQSPKTAGSPTKRDEINKFYKEGLYNRLTPANLGLRLVIMQRLEELDLSGTLLKENPEEYELICLPATLQDNVFPKELVSFYKDGLLDPIRLNKKVLLGLKKSLGSSAYAGQYDQRPAPAEGGIIKKEWFDIVSPETLTRDVLNEPIHFFIDSAYTEKTTNDPTAILTCFLKSGIIYVLDVVQVWLEFPELIKYVKKHVAKFQLSSDSKIYLEPKASGVSVAQTLRAETSLNIIELAPPDKDKVVRANGVTPKMESKRMKMVAGSYIEGYLDELATFPNAAHDDRVDVTVYAIDTLLPANDNPDFAFLG